MSKIIKRGTKHLTSRLRLYTCDCGSVVQFDLRADSQSDRSGGEPFVVCPVCGAFVSVSVLGGDGESDA